jgi:GNAT superfamily N-acetyltransferase
VTLGGPSITPRDSGLVIRRATVPDAAVFLDLLDALADYENLPRPTAEARERLLRDGFGETTLFRSYIVELEGRAVGYAITVDTYSSFLARPTLFLEDVFVIPEARGMGIGRAIFRFLAREALDRDCGRMEWVVLDWNELAIGFYERLGARQLSEWLPYRLTRDQLEQIANP